jgi:hypothetical protein
MRPSTPTGGNAIRVARPAIAGDLKEERLSCPES